MRCSRPEPAHHLHGIWVELDAGADTAERGSLLVDTAARSPSLRSVAAAVSPAMPAPTMAIAGVFRATVRSGQPLGSDGCKPTHPAPCGECLSLGSVDFQADGVGDAGVEATSFSMSLLNAGRIERQRIDAQSRQPLLH